MSADEQLEAFGELGVVCLLLGKRAHFQRMVDHEGGLDELGLGHRLEDLGDQLALAPGRVGMAAVALEDAHQLVARAREVDGLARALRGQLDHGRRAPLARQVDQVALVFHLQRAARRLRRRLEAAAREAHHALQVAERLVGLHGGELGVVRVVHAFVAELAPQLEHLLEAADQQALERQLGGDAQEVVAVERVEVRDEGTRVRTAQDAVQKRRLHLHEALLFHVRPDGRHDGRALHERVAHLGVHDHVDVALAVARLLVGEAVELLGKRAQGLRQQLEGIDRDGQLPAARAHDGAVHAQPVAHVDALDLLEGPLAQRVDAAEQLDGPRRVHELEERDLALHAARHHAAREHHFVLGGLAVGERAVLFLEVGHEVAALERMAVRVAAVVDHRLALRLADLDRVVLDRLRFCHLFSHCLSSQNGRT